MRIAILGAGFTGLSAAYHLSHSGHQVTVFEKLDGPGGLALGFKRPNWDWSLEEHYHHLFTNDSDILELARLVNHPILVTHPQTSTFVNGGIFRTDSAGSLLKFSPLSFFDRLRAGFSLALLKFNPLWQPFEYFTAKRYLLFTAGKAVWNILWRPLFEGKFSTFADQISAAWFWARIFKRTSDLAYPRGGFLSLARSIESAAVSRDAKFVYHTEITKITRSPRGGIDLQMPKSKLVHFDKVICTLPTFQFARLTGLSYPRLAGLGAINLVLELKQSFFPDGTYWLNINDRTMPFLAVVEHTNFMNPDHYGGSRLLYIGNYLSPDHKFFSLTPDQLLAKFYPHLKKINPAFSRSWIKNSFLFSAPFAQPVVTPGYSRLLPGFVTSIPNLYLANIQQVYPYDRGTNYAVKLGKHIAKLCIAD